MWNGLPCTARILYNRISKFGVTVVAQNKFRSMLIKEYGYVSEKSATSNDENENSDISILLNEPRYARNEPQ